LHGKLAMLERLRGEHDGVALANGPLWNGFHNGPSAIGTPMRLFEAGLDALQQVEANFQGRRFLFRSQLTADAFASSPRHGRGDTPTLRELQ